MSADANLIISMKKVVFFYVFLSQESPDEVPDVVPTHVLLQTRGAAAVHRLDQQQRFQAILFTFSQMVSRVFGEFSSKRVNA